MIASRTPFLAVLVALMLALPGAAFAATPGDDVYYPADKRAKVAVLSSASDGDGDGDGLPFTGLEVGLVALAGAAILGTGIAIRRASRTDSG